MQTVRRRIITRARFLQTNPGFLEAMRASVAAWNREHREFQTQQVLPFPDRLPGDIGPGLRPRANEPVFLPPENLARALAEARPSLEAFEARVAWQDRIECLSNLWWTPEYFPRWTGPVAHPAAGFVRACHMFAPLQLDIEAWILRTPWVPFLLAYNPADGSSHRDPVRRIDQHSRFYALLVDAVRAGTPVTEDLLAALDSEADHEAAREALERPHDEFPYLPILPGLARRDYRDAESAVVSLADNHLHDCARELSKRGHSFQRIAGELGVHRKTIKSWLSSEA